MLNRLREFMDAVRAGWSRDTDARSPRGLAFRAGLALALALLTLVLFPPARGLQVPNLRLGVVAPDDVLAPFDFPVFRSDDELADLRAEAASAVRPVFQHRPARADSAVAVIDAFLEPFAGYGEGDPELARLNRIGDRRGVFRPEELRALARPGVRAALRSLAREALPAVYEEQYMLRSDRLSEIVTPQVAVVTASGVETIVPREEIVALAPGVDLPVLGTLSRAQEPVVERLATELIPALIPGSLEFQMALTGARMAEARRTVSPVKSEVLADELIVGAHTRVTEEQAEKLRSLEAELERRRGGWTLDDVRGGLGKILLSLALLSLLGFFLFLYREDVFDDYRAVGVLTVVWGIVIGLTALFYHIDAIPVFAAPVALASVIVAILWDARLAIIVTLFLAIFLGSHIEPAMPLVWSAILAGLAGAWSVRRFRRRTQFYETLLFVIVGHAVAVGAIALTEWWSWGALIVSLGWVSLGAAIAVFTAMALMPVLEWASGRTTDLTLLELADLNRPLLKQMMFEAPGTYHHSMVVGNLAETAAERIGANSLMVRVGAYYHDIGKVRRPEFFAENQRAGINPHLSLAPEASARIVSRHVQDGVEMGVAAGLPDRVVDFIREHHGTTRLTYFWHEAEKSGKGEVPSLGDFVYPGPRPRSKETAIVMLADSVEAASRLVTDPTPERLREMVRKIISMKLDEDQLDEADLTFRDLAIVEDTFVGVLGGIHHRRVDYPSVSLHTPRQVDDASDSVSSSRRSTR